VENEKEKEGNEIVSCKMVVVGEFMVYYGLTTNFQI
jgi:hypothetical protein